MFVFWSILAAVPLVGNLGGAWLLVEATTAASALLVGFGGKPRALEAGWKYLILTSLGLGVALLGIVMLAAGSVHGGLDALSWRSLAHVRSDNGTALVAYLLLLSGLAAKIGWAPVHTWLPDAHWRLPLRCRRCVPSSALLPAVLSHGGRARRAAPAIGATAVHSKVLIGLGCSHCAGRAVPLAGDAVEALCSPTLSSRDMGVIALPGGIGFGTPLAIAGAAIHVAGHALAKALGFYAATPLLGHDPRSASHAAAGIGRTQPRLAGVLGLSLGALAGIPPSPLFVSEVLIVGGGFAAGRPWSAAIAAVLLTLGFLGLAHALLETTAGNASAHRRPAPGLRGVTVLAAVTVPCLLALAAAALWLPGSAIARALTEGLRSPTATVRGRARRRLCFAALRGGGRSRRAGRAAAPEREPPLPEPEPVQDGHVLSIVDLTAAAGWDERRRDFVRKRFTATSRYGRSSVTSSRSIAGPCPCAAATPTRSRSGRSTPA